MSFQWDETPEAVFGPGIELWQSRLVLVLDTLVEDGAIEAERFMKAYAPWTDQTKKARQGLYAYPIPYGVNEDHVGIVASYSGAINPTTGEDYSYALEQYTFPVSGILSIILDRRQPTFLGEYARRFFDRVKAQIE